MPRPAPRAPRGATLILRRGLAPAVPSSGGCKVDDVIREYDLALGDDRAGTIDDHLLARWTGERGQEAQGYRTLTTWFNKRLLKRAYDRHGRSTMGTRLDSEYRALVGDDDIRRQEVLADLAADGLDGEALRDDMVSWSTMRHHLQGCLDGEKAAPSGGDWERESIEVVRGGAVERLRKVLRSLDSKGAIEGADDAEVEVLVRLTCPECPTRVTLAEALERGVVCEAHSPLHNALNGTE